LKITNSHRAIGTARNIMLCLTVKRTEENVLSMTQ